MPRKRKAKRRTCVVVVLQNPTELTHLTRIETPATAAERSHVSFVRPLLPADDIGTAHETGYDAAVRREAAAALPSGDNDLARLPKGRCYKWTSPAHRFEAGS